MFRDGLDEGFVRQRGARCVWLGAGGEVDEL